MSLERSWGAVLVTGSEQESLGLSSIRESGEQESLGLSSIRGPELNPWI